MPEGRASPRPRPEAGRARQEPKEKPQDAAKDEQHAETLRDKYRFLVQRLRADIRFLVHSLPEFADLPEELAGQRPWPEAIAELEADVAGLAPAAPGEGALSLDAVVSLLNCRDRIICSLASSLLFQKALLDCELKLARANPVGLMADLGQQVERLLARGGRPPERYELPALPAALEPGPFTYDKTRAGGQAAGPAGAQADAGDGELSQLQGRLLCTLREMQSLDKSIRHVKFGSKVLVPDKRHSSGRLIGSDELRREITRLFDKCSRLEHELQTRKAQRHTPWEVQVEYFKQRCAEKDQQNLQYKSRVHKLEGEVSNYKQDYASLRREKAEIAEKNQKMVSENLPDLDRIDAQLAAAREAVDRLTADAEMLSSMFRLQVEDSQKYVAERDEVARELNKVRRQLKGERESNKFKEDELQKKETLYQRTVEAREATLKAYQEQKLKIREVEERARGREAAWQGKLREVQGRDAEIAGLKADLRRAHQDIDELEQQKKVCLEEFQTATGRPFSMLLEQFKVPPPAEAPAKR